MVEGSCRFTRSIRAPSKIPMADGIGDLPGITSKLDYLQKLGVNVLWLSPYFDSPNVDGGYDIRDYRKVMTEFRHHGPTSTRFSAASKQRHMRLIIDLVVVNHTSDENKWFVESRSSKDQSLPRLLYLAVGPHCAGRHPHSAQQLPVPTSPAPPGASSPKTNEYYLHYFTAKQPDLNWEEPKVREDVLQPHALLAGTRASMASAWM